MKIKFLPQLDENAIRIWKKDVRSKLFLFSNDVDLFFVSFLKMELGKWAKPCLGQNKEHQKQFISGCKLDVYPI